MPQIRLTLTDDHGKNIERVFYLDSDLDTLEQIEQAVERFKQAALPDVEKALLTQAQQRFVTQEKKTLPEKQR
jgi:hypothetical protein